MLASEPFDDAAFPLGLPSEGPEGRGDLEAIEAELADHLACAGAAAEREGASPDDARRQANARFGDVRRVARQCWWIQRGDQVMWRSLQTALLALVFVSVAALAVAGWRWQRDFSRQMETLTDKLATIAERPASPLAAAEREPALREIRGYAFIGDESKPAAKAEVSIYDAAGKQVRSLMTGDDGHFATGVLPEGEYSIVAPYVSENNLVRWTGRPESSKTDGMGGAHSALPISPPLSKRPLYWVECGPISLQTGRTTPELKLNLDLPRCDITWELAGVLADHYQVGDKRWEISLGPAPIGEASNPTSNWRESNRSKAQFAHSTIVKNFSLFEPRMGQWLPSQCREAVPLAVDPWADARHWPLPNGIYQIGVWLGVHCDSPPSADAKQPDARQIPMGFGRRLTATPDGGYGGAVSFGANYQSELSILGARLAHVDVDVKPYRRTHLRLVLDDGFEAAVQRVLTERPANEDIIALSKLARLEVVGEFPLDRSATE